MKVPDTIVIDFETEPIRKRPDYPPRPVSMSIQMPHWDKPRFFAWGHKTGRNPHTLNDAKRILHAAYDTGLPFLAHNMKFEMDILETHFGLPPLGWERAHDTQFLMFLSNPHSKNMGLKEQAAEHLKMPPEERDAVKDWIVEHKTDLEHDFPEILNVYAPPDAKGPGGIKPSNASAFIAWAPPSVVEAYCNGDVIRTGKLFRKLYREISQRKMVAPYNRERRLSPVLLKNEREGIRVDLLRIRKLDQEMSDALLKTDAWLRKKLRSETLSLDSGDDVVDALKHTKLGKNFLLTPTGKDSRSMDSIHHAVTDKQLKSAFAYRTMLANQHRNFVKGWRVQAERSFSRIHTVWNQVRSGDEDLSGARTGRLSSDAPNILAVTKGLGKKAKDFVHPEFLDVMQLPWLRSLLLPDAGGIWVCRDFRQQEYRLAAEAEEGALYEAYRSDHATDVHKFVHGEIKRIMGLDLPRGIVKELNFGTLFGMGIPALMLRTGKTKEECQAFRAAHKAALPGIAALDDDMKEMGRRGEYIQTWGGRQYYAEPPRMVKDKRTKIASLRTYEYKLLNCYTQGGGADVTKETLIRYDAAQGRRGRLLAPVHDEVNTSAPIGVEREEAELLGEVMRSIEMDVPMLSDCKIGPSWGEVQEYVK